MTASSICVRRIALSAAVVPDSAFSIPECQNPLCNLGSLSCESGFVDEVVLAHCLPVAQDSTDGANRGCYPG